MRAVAASQGGRELASTTFKIRVRLPESSGEPELISCATTWGNEKGPVRERYTYYEESAMKHPSMRKVKKWESEHGKVYHGEFIEYDAQGRKQRLWTYKYGIKDGPYYSYDTQGNVAFQGNYKEGIQDGSQANLAPDGGKNWEHIHENGKLVCEIVYYGKGSKAPFAQKVTMRMMDEKEGLQEGEWESYWENGNLHKKGAYREHRAVAGADGIGGSAHGPWIVKYENGNTREQGDYLKGLREGSWSFFYDTGKKREVGTFSMGKRDGQWQFFDEKERLVTDAVYAKDKEVSAEVRDYYENGTLRSVTRRRDGVSHGECVNYYEDGKKSRLSHYDSGFCASEIEYYPDEKVHIERKNTKTGQNSSRTEHAEYWGDGKVKEKGAYVTDNGDEKRVGRWIVRILPGEARGEGDYVDGQRSGRWTITYASGAKSVGSYKAGNRDGRWEEYDAKGKAVSWTDYRDDKPVGGGRYKD